MTPTPPIETKLKWYPATQAEVDRLIEAGEWQYSDIILCTSCENAPFAFQLRAFNPSNHRGQMAKIEWPKEGERVERFNENLINENSEYCIKLLYSKIQSLEEDIRIIKTRTPGFK